MTQLFISRTVEVHLSNKQTSAFIYGGGTRSACISVTQLPPRGQEPLCPRKYAMKTPLSVSFSNSTLTHTLSSK